MGKPEEVPVEVSDLEAGAASVSGGGASGIFRSFSFRCVLVLALSAGLLLSAVFWLLPLHHTRRSEFVNDDPYSFHAEVQASFILEKPISLLATYAERLEYEIFEEIGIPNTKVSIISMHSLAQKNSTLLVFGFLPDPKNASISSPALSILRSTLIDLVLRQINISLTTSIFGHSSSFELLKFPGGITVIPLQSASIWEIAQILFDFTLNNTIEDILENIDRLKDELKFGLNLRSYENVFVKLTNRNGSTVSPPVLVQASVLSDVGSGILLPDRMKQLAQMITGPGENNLGLNNSVFGKVKQVQLSSYLEHSISSLAPGPSPSASPSPSPSDGIPTSSSPLNPPAPAPAPALSHNHHGQPPCFYSHSPPGSLTAIAPSPKIGILPHSRAANAPRPLRRRDTDPVSNCYSCPSAAPSSVLPVHAIPPISSDHSPTMTGRSSHEVISPTPKVSQEPSLPPTRFASSPLQNNGRGIGLSSAPSPSYTSSSSLSKPTIFIMWESKLIGLLGLLLFQLVCWPR